MRLIVEIFKDYTIPNNFIIAQEGKEAMHMLNGEGEYIDFPRPDLILLDLDLPKMDGREVLKRIKNDDNLKTIPVVILTSSSEEKDIVDSYNHYVNAYITKPLNLTQYSKVVKSIEEFWLNIANLPKKANIYNL